MSMMNKHLCAFIEFEQAFDIVWRNGLWSKLINNGVNEKWLIIIIHVLDIGSQLWKSNQRFKYE